MRARRRRKRRGERRGGGLTPLPLGRRAQGGQRSICPYSPLGLAPLNPRGADTRGDPTAPGRGSEGFDAFIIREDGGAAGGLWKMGGCLQAS